MANKDDIVRVEVTFNKKKHAEILAAMAKYGNQAGFLKFAANHYLNTASGNNPGPSVQLDITEGKGAKTIEPEKKNTQRRLPPGFGNQAISTRLED